MKNKNIFLIVAGIIILVIAVLLFWNSSKETPEYVEPKSDIEQMVSDDQGSDAVIINGPNEECPEETKVSITVTGEEIVNLYAEIARLEAELAACMEGKEPKSSAATTPTRTTKKSVTKRQAPSKSETTRTTAPEKSQISDSEMAVNKYQGIIVGDKGNTFDGDSKMFYYVRASLLNAIEGRDRTDTHLMSPKGIQGEIIGDYVIFKTNEIVLMDKLDKEWTWGIYIGDHVQYKYDMWLPHELYKLNNNLANDPEVQMFVPGDPDQGFYYKTKLQYKPK